VGRFFNPTGGLIFLAVYGAAIISLTTWIARRHTLDKVDFLLASRKLGVLPAAMSISSSWIWAPALFVAAQKAYEQGLAGVFWFTFPNFLALVVFAPFAFRIRKRLPLGYTLPQYMRLRHGRGVHVLYLIQFSGLQICSYAVQILAGATLIETVTGLSFHAVALVLAAITLTYTVIGGLRSTVATDFIQMAIILSIVSITVPWAVTEAGGLSAVAGGLGGASGNFRNLFDPWVAYSFGIPVTIGLLSGPLGDQMHWQRAYAIGSDRRVVKTFLLGAILFVVVPLSLSLLGFLAANKNVSGGWSITSNQMVAPITVSYLLPSFMTFVYVSMVLVALCSTLDSILCAASSLASVDLDQRPSNDPTDEHDPRRVSIARLGMFITAGLGLAIAFIPRLQIVHLFLFYGTWRASTMIPTVLSLSWDRINSRAVFAAILASLMFGAPVYALGTLLNNPHLSVSGSILVVIIGLTTCVVWSMLRPNSDKTLSHPTVKEPILKT
jgi:SSS family transporter